MPTDGYAVMTLVKTILGALALCAALLGWIDYAAGPVPASVEPPGLTAATVLATDGMGPDGRPGEPALDGQRPRPPVGAAGLEASRSRAADEPAG